MFPPRYRLLLASFSLLAFSCGTLDEGADNTLGDGMSASGYALTADKALFGGMLAGSSDLEIQSGVQGGEPYTFIYAYFARETDDGCTVTQVSPTCDFYECDDQPLPPLLDAGTLRLTDRRGEEVVIEPQAFPGEDGSTSYAYFFDEPRIIFPGGSHVRVRTEGAAGGVSSLRFGVQVPFEANVTEPVLDDPTPLTVARTSPLKIRWEGPETERRGNVQAWLWVNPTDPTLPLPQYLRCDFPSRPGKAQIPSVALGRLTAGTDGGLIVSSRTDRRLTRRRWQIRARALSGLDFPRDVVFQ